MCGCDFLKMVIMVLGLDQLLSALPAFIFAAVDQVEQEITGTQVPALGPAAYCKLCVCVCV